jgi:hypothetical protein
VKGLPFPVRSSPFSSNKHGLNLLKRIFPKKNMPEHRLEKKKE